MALNITYGEVKRRLFLLRSVGAGHEKIMGNTTLDNMCGYMDDKFLGQGAAQSWTYIMKVANKLWKKYNQEGYDDGYSNGFDEAVSEYEENE